MKYNVILASNKERNYYYSYVEKNGNIEVDELPPYQDINMARSCYYSDGAWIFDEIKYSEIVAAEAEAKAEAEQKKAEADAVPSNAELAEAVMELADNISDVMDALSELATSIAELKGDE